MTDVAAQKERAFRAAFANGDEISVYGPISTSVMQWGIDRGYAERVGETTTYRVTCAGRAALTPSTDDGTYGRADTGGGLKQP